MLRCGAIGVLFFPHVIEEHPLDPLVLARSLRFRLTPSRPSFHTPPPLCPVAAVGLVSGAILVGSLVAQREDLTNQRYPTPHQAALDRADLLGYRGFIGPPSLRRLIVHERQGEQSDPGGAGLSRKASRGVSSGPRQRVPS